MAMFDFLNDFGRPSDYGGILTPEQRDQAQMMSVLALAGPLLEAAGPSPVRQGIGSAFGKGIAGMMQAQRGAVSDAMQQRLFQMKMDEIQQERQNRLGYRKTLDELGRGRPPMIDVTATPETPDMAYSPGQEPAIPPVLAQILQYAKPDVGATALLRGTLGGAGHFGKEPFYTQDEKGNLTAWQLNAQGGLSVLKLPSGHIPAPTNMIVKQGDKNVVIPGRGVPPPNAAEFPVGTPPHLQIMPDGTVVSVPGGSAGGPAPTPSAVSVPKTEREKKVGAVEFSNKVAPLEAFQQVTQEVMTHPGLESSTGILGVLPAIPGTDSADARAKLKQLKSKSAQAVLQMYKDMSRAGGAVGQVSNFEQEMFQNNLAALDRAQNYDQMKSELNNLNRWIDGSISRLKSAYEAEYGAPAPTTTAPSSIRRWKVVNGQLVPE